jgi:hypothetical protein
MACSKMSLQQSLLLSTQLMRSTTRVTPCDACRRTHETTFTADVISAVLKLRVAACSAEQRCNCGPAPGLTNGRGAGFKAL